MQDHPNPPRTTAVPRPGSPEHEVQRWLLLELVTTPPPEGDEVGALVASLNEPRQAIEIAVQALVDVGLAERDDDTVRASHAAMRFEALWPVRA